jgi:hypothetical protein
MRTIEASVAVAAPPGTVWSVLADTAAYGEWNPFIEAVDGELRTGGRLRVRLHLPGSRAITMKPRLLELDPPRRLRWLGRTGVPGVFDGDHRFAIEPTAAGAHVTQSEVFRGVLVPLVWRWLRPKTLAGFDAMNEALKTRVEARATGPRH